MTDQAPVSPAILRYGVVSPEEDTVRIQKALAGLEPFGVPLKNFNYHTIVNCFFTPKKFLKLSRTVVSHPDNVRSALIDIGVKREFYKHPQEMDVSSFVDLCMFVKSKEGHQILLEIQKCLKLEKKVKRARERYGVETAELESTINELEHKRLNLDSMKCKNSK